MALTDTAIRRSKPTEKAYKLFDSGGLHLLFTPAGGRLWRWKYRFVRQLHSHLPPSPPSCIRCRTDGQNSHSEAANIAGGHTVRTNSHQNSHQIKMATCCRRPYSLQIVYFVGARRGT
jgi:hypothetical protein